MKHRSKGGIPIALKDTRRKAHLALRVTTARLALACLDTFRAGHQGGLVRQDPLVMTWGRAELGDFVFTLGVRSTLTRAEARAVRQGLADAGLSPFQSKDGKFYCVVNEYSAVAA